MRINKRLRKAFTLVELVVVIAIIAIFKYSISSNILWNN